MEQNYLKGRVTVVFAASNKHPLYGKILPDGCSQNDHSKQLNFNAYALKENPKFPEESGECELDYKDSGHWNKHEKGDEVFYTPILPFTVYFKTTDKKDSNGNIRKVAICIHSEKTATEEMKHPTKRMSLADLENASSGHAAVKDNKPKAKVKHEPVFADSDDDEGALLEAAYQEDYAADNANYQVPRYSPLDAADRDEVEYNTEERKEEETDEVDDYETYGDYGTQKIVKHRWDDER